MTKRITKAYLKENKTLHEASDYGAWGHRHLGRILALCEAVGASTVLDYGAGKATLGPFVERYGLSYTPYDPATFPDRPKHSFDVTVCTDVLEHIEPDLLPSVLDDLAAYTAKASYIVVATRLSSKSISDGSNAHRIVQSWGWWKHHLLHPRFHGHSVEQSKDGYFTLIAVAPKFKEASGIALHNALRKV